MITLNKDTIILIIIGLIYLISVIKVIRSIDRHKTPNSDKLIIHNEFTNDNQDVNYDYAIKSNKCGLCNRIDIIHIDRDTIISLAENSPIGVGSYSINHSAEPNTDEYHNVTHYLGLENNQGKWIGDKIPHNELIQASNERDLIEFE